MFFIEHEKELINLENVYQITIKEDARYSFVIRFHIAVTVSSDEFGTLGDRVVDMHFDDPQKGMLFLTKLKRLIVKFKLDDGDE